ncbi:MAG: RNA polymerase sigma-70 factor [Bacteroidales bacterium]|jgi:RNA polymerase sigma-70 factor (ECF subfamily)|nr:RNA polymerase sigma-70 factor [Bacteroidales bacterium]
MNEDSILIISLKKGNRNAFNTLFEKYSPKLYFFILKTFQNKVEAEEIVQDTFLKIWETRRRIDEKQHFNTYLISIAKHLIYDHLRHKAVERKYSQHALQASDKSYSVDDELALESLRDYIIAKIELLPPQQKEILLLKNKGYENDEIAKLLSLSKRTVETHINRAFKSLRNSLAHGKELFIGLAIGLLQ